MAAALTAITEHVHFAETDLVKYVKLESKLLSAFHGRPIFLRAGVIPMESRSLHATINPRWNGFRE